MGGQPGKPKPLGNPPIRQEPQRPQPIEEPPRPLPVPPVERPPLPVQASNRLRKKSRFQKNGYETGSTREFGSREINGLETRASQ
jgi:hypothetical protein